MVFTEMVLAEKIKELDLELFTEMAVTEKIKELDLELVSHTSYTCCLVVRCFVSVRHIWCLPRRR